MHVQHMTTGEWKFNVGAGWVDPPWKPRTETQAALPLAKHKQIQCLTARTPDLIADGGFTYQNKVFDISTLDAQLNWTNVAISAANLPYPYRVRTKDGTDYYDFPDASEMLAAYGAAVGAKSLQLLTESGMIDYINSLTTVDEVEAFVDNRS